MDIVSTYFFVMMAIIIISRAITAKMKEKKQAELLERNPEAWKRLKELEMEKKDRNRRVAGGALISILRIILKK